MLQPRRLRGPTQAQRSPAERRLEYLVDAGLGLAEAARRHGDDGFEARMRRQTAAAEALRLRALGQRVALTVRRLAAREIRRAGS